MLCMMSCLTCVVRNARCVCVVYVVGGVCGAYVVIVYVVVVRRCMLMMLLMVLLYDVGVV